MGAKGSAAEDAKKARVFVDWIVDHYAPKAATFGAFTQAPAEEVPYIKRGTIPRGLRVGDLIRTSLSDKWDIIEAVYGDVYVTAERTYIVGYHGYWECN